MWPAGLKARLTLIATAIAIVGGSLTAANQAQVAEPMWLATRSFVRIQVSEQQNYLKAQLAPIEQRQIQQEIGQLRASRDGARDKLFDLDLLLKKDGIDPDVNRNIHKQQQDLQDRIDAINARLNVLQKEIGR